MLAKIKAYVVAAFANPREAAKSLARSVLGYALGLLAFAALLNQVGYDLPNVAVQVLAGATVVAGFARTVLAALDPTNSDFGISSKAGR